MYGRKSPDRWNKRVQVASFFLFLIFAIVFIIGVNKMISEIGKIAQGQQKLILNVTGQQPEDLKTTLKVGKGAAYVTYNDFIQHQRKYEKEFKSLKYELERLRAKISKRSNPL